MHECIIKILFFFLFRQLKVEAVDGLVRYLVARNKRETNPGEEIQPDVLEKAFQFIDNDHDGYITDDEISGILAVLIGMEKSRSVANEIINESDTNSDGRPEFEGMETFL